MYRMFLFSIALSALVLFTGCSEHDCRNIKDKKSAWNDIAKITKGADRCSLSKSGSMLQSFESLRVTHYQAKVEDVSAQFAERLKAQGWQNVTVEDYKGKRANGKPLSGKQVLAIKGKEKLIAKSYYLADGIVDSLITTSSALDKVVLPY